MTMWHDNGGMDCCYCIGCSVVRSEGLALWGVLKKFWGNSRKSKRIFGNKPGTPSGISPPGRFRGGSWGSLWMPILWRPLGGFRDTLEVSRNYSGSRTKKHTWAPSGITPPRFASYPPVHSSIQIKLKVLMIFVFRSTNTVTVRPRPHCLVYGPPLAFGVVFVVGGGFGFGVGSAKIRP